jgi:hypothetical protein
MKLLNTLLLVFALAAPAWALSAEHPAASEVSVAALSQTDSFTGGKTVLAAADTEHAAHDHKAATKQGSTGNAEQGKSCKRESGCCKCCCKCGGKEEKQDAKTSEMKDCDMMKKKMDKADAKPEEGGEGKDAEHESHH